MADPARRRKRHAAPSGRILTAGLSSAAAFGMVAGMAITNAASPPVAASDPAAHRTEPDRVPPPTATTGAPQAIVVIRRHWVPAPSGNTSAQTSTPTAAMPTPLLVTSPARPAQGTPPTTVEPASPQPVPRPVTRTRGS
jgi:hypothetical protein